MDTESDIPPIAAPAALPGSGARPTPAALPIPAPDALPRPAAAPAAPDVAPATDAAVGGEALAADPAEPGLIVARRTRMVPVGTFEMPALIRPVSQPDGWNDTLTGADGPRLWDRLILSEQARTSRYHRPVTVAFAEIVGLERVAGQWGWDVAGRALASCARRLGREIRSSDHIARLEQARFGILLTETTEIAAINFVERARASCERELKAVGDDVSIGFGWASPPARGDLSDAIGIALTRLAAELAGNPTG